MWVNIKLDKMVMNSEEVRNLEEAAVHLHVALLLRSGF
jgi:hypothetical protein